MKKSLFDSKFNSDRKVMFEQIHYIQTSQSEKNALASVSNFKFYELFSTFFYDIFYLGEYTGDDYRNHVSYLKRMVKRRQYMIKKERKEERAYVKLRKNTTNYLIGNSPTNERRILEFTQAEADLYISCLIIYFEELNNGKIPKQAKVPKTKTISKPKPHQWRKDKFR